jgi:hypothetical protein
LQRTKWIFAIATLLLAALVQAHAKVTATFPADGDYVAAPARLVVEFDSPVRLTGIAIVSVSGDRLEISSLPAEPATHFGVDIPSPLAPGEYYVVWKAIAADTHFSTGEFFFTITDD